MTYSEEFYKKRLESQLKKHSDSPRAAISLIEELFRDLEAKETKIGQEKARLLMLKEEYVAEMDKSKVPVV
jgi:hypothetical protein